MAKGNNAQKNDKKSKKPAKGAKKAAAKQPAVATKGKASKTK